MKEIRFISHFFDEISLSEQKKVLPFNLIFYCINI